MIIKFSLITGNLQHDARMKIEREKTDDDESDEVELSSHIQNSGLCDGRANGYIILAGIEIMIATSLVYR